MQDIRYQMSLHNKAAKVKMFINQATAMSSGELEAMTLATRDMQQSESLMECWTIPGIRVFIYGRQMTT